jgi:hypothetical protein
MMADLDSYAEDLLQAKGITKLGQADYDDVKADLIDQVDEQIDAMIIDRLPDSAKDAFSHLLDGGDEEKLEAFLAAFIPDLEYYVDKVLLEFRQSYLAAAA